MFFHALTFFGVHWKLFEHEAIRHCQRDLASVNAMKIKCVIVFFLHVLPDFSINCAVKIAQTLNIPFLTLDISKQNGISVKLSNVIMWPQVIYACNVFTNKSIREIISHYRNA